MTDLVKRIAAEQGGVFEEWLRLPTQSDVEAKVRQQRVIDQNLPTTTN